MEKPDLQQIFGSYMAWKIDSQTWIISFMGGTQYLYLLEGSQKALLIDTGFGAGNLRAFVEKLTDKPLLVLNTHFHPDHAGGNGEFEAVYMSKNAPLDENSVLVPGAVPFDLSKLPHPDYRRIFVGEGSVIDLGGRKIEIFDALPAHCNSSLFLLDRVHRMLFCGDDLEAGQVNLFNNSKNKDLPYDCEQCLRNFQQNCRRLMALSGEFDWLLPNHNGTPLAKSYIDEGIELIDALYSGAALIEDDLHHPYIARDVQGPLLCRVRWKHTSIFTYKETAYRLYGSRKIT